MEIKYNDGGRQEAGYRGDTGDCVTRAIAIALELDYKEVYSDLFQRQKDYKATRRTKLSRYMNRRSSISPRNGIWKEIYRPYLEEKGWKFVPTMGFGTGTKVHLKADELPGGRIICRLSKHLVAVIDGVINDTYDCSRDETRCVYGYFVKA